MCHSIHITVLIFSTCQPLAPARVLAAPVALHRTLDPRVAGLVTQAALPLLLLRPAPRVPPGLPLDPAPCSPGAREGAPHKTGARCSPLPPIALHLVRPLEVVALLVAGSSAHIELPALVVPLLLDSSPGGGLATVTVDLLAGPTSLLKASLTSAVTSMLAGILSLSRPGGAGLDLVCPLEIVALLVPGLGADMELSALVGSLLLNCPLYRLHPAVAAESVLLL